MRVDESRSVVKFQSWILLRELVSDRVNNIILLDRAELFFLRTQGWVSFVNFPRVTSVACFVVRCLRFFCETSFTLLPYRAGHLRTVHVSQLHLSAYLTPELIS